MKRRKEGVSESEEGTRESVLSDDPPDSKWVFQNIPSNWWFLLPLKKGLPILQYESISDIISLIITARYQIEVPDDLRHVLANDWDLVVHQKYLFKVPAKVTTY